MDPLINFIHGLKQVLIKGRKRLSHQSRPILIEIYTSLGIPVRFQSPARTVLENTILPYYAAQPHISKILFVGCDWYTKHYSKVFRKCEYTTLDPDTGKKRYGSKRHIVGYLENLGNYFEQGYFDLILCNGVLGFGLNQFEQAEGAFNNCYDCLRKGGEFMLGRDDDETLVEFPIDRLTSLRKFTPREFPPLKTFRYSMKPAYNYIFCFYIKPDSNSSDTHADSLAADGKKSVHTFLPRSIC